MVENKGLRHSTVNNYEIEIMEFKKKFSGVRPIEGQCAFQGRGAQHCLNPATISRTGNIAIEPEKTTDRGILRFIVSDTLLQNLKGVGLQMDPGTRKFPPLHCRLTLTDTEGWSASQLFVLNEGE